MNSIRELVDGVNQWEHVNEWASELPNRKSNGAVGFGECLIVTRDGY